MISFRIAIGVVLVPAILLLAACSPADRPEDLTPIPTLAAGPTVTLVPEIQGAASAGEEPGISGQASAAAGAPLYLLNCTPCHGNQGQGVDAPALRNSQYVQSAGDETVAATIASGISGSEMPAWLHDNGGPLTGTQIGDVIAYLHTLQDVPAGVTLAPDAGPTGPAATMAGTAADGQAQFGVFCAFCHGPEGVQGLPNPGSDDGTVPVLNPIDPEIASSDVQAFADNVDLYLEHGSLPEGSDPLLLMPPFGDREMLSDAQIADLIAYVLEINGVSP